jgi:hypothetical protein
MPNTYRIVRFYQNEDYDTEIVAHGLSLAQAKEHCSGPEASSTTATKRAAVARTTRRGTWFEGFEEE